MVGGEALGDLVAAQAGVVSRGQALSRGMTRHSIAARLAGGRWQKMYRGVYATFSGEPARLAGYGRRCSWLEKARR